MLTPEGKIKKAIKKILGEESILFYMPMGSGWGRSGMPDFVLSVNGIFVGIEAKAGSNTPTDLQARELNKINQSGGLGICINADNIDTLPRLIRNLKLTSSRG
jgi:hypothetical protein